MVTVMKKIGIFLESEPSGGGIFQHNQIILDAVAALPRDRFSVVVCYTSPLWLDYLKDYDMKSVLVERGFWGRALGLGWQLLGLPMGLWRRVSPLVFPLSRALLREGCDLWIFPSQDARGYQVPVPSLIVIADLMHRYERSFPESGSRWQYLVRDRHYANICRFAKGVLVDSELGRRHVMESYGAARERIHVLPLIAPRYMSSARTPQDFEERYRLPAKFIFYPAAFWEHKNHKRLLRAVAALKQELPDLKIVLAGSKKNAYASVASLVQELQLADEVTFLGYVPDADMPELYRRARALVMPTFFGPTNIPPSRRLWPDARSPSPAPTACPNRPAARRFTSIRNRCPKWRTASGACGPTTVSAWTCRRRGGRGRQTGGSSSSMSGCWRSLPG